MAAYVMFLVSTLCCCFPFLNGASNFKFVKDRMTFFQASQSCEEWGGELLSIENTAQNTQAYKELRRRGIETAWIGLNDIKREKSFVWTDPQSVDGYTNWADNQPNNLGGNQHCAVIDVSLSGKWNDVSCFDRRSYICFRESFDLQYIFVKDILTGKEADVNCHKMGAELVTVQSAEQNAFIYKQMKKRGMRGAWIGYNDIVEEGNFEWSDIGRCSKYTNWKKGQPNNRGGNEDCTVVATGLRGKWVDTNCNHRYSSICFKALVVPTQFKFIKEVMTWKKAEENCQRLGGELAFIENAAQNNFIYLGLKKRQLEAAWIGYNDIQQEGHFVWSDSTFCSKYTNWAKTQPNNSGGDEDCTEINVSLKGQWSDDSCERQLPSICYKMVGF